MTKERADFAEQLAWRVPIMTGAGMLGFPRDNHSRLADLFKTAVHRNPGERVTPLQAIETAGNCGLRQAHGRGPPPRSRRNDFLTTIVTAEIASRRLSEEVVGVRFLIMGGRADPPASGSANSPLPSAEHHEQRARLLEGPDAIPVVAQSFGFDQLRRHSSSPIPDRSETPPATGWSHTKPTGLAIDGPRICASQRPSSRGAL
jgi:cytochrome P450